MLIKCKVVCGSRPKARSGGRPGQFSTGMPFFFLGRFIKLLGRDADRILFKARNAGAAKESKSAACNLLEVSWVHGLISTSSLSRALLVLVQQAWSAAKQDTTNTETSTNTAPRVLHASGSTATDSNSTRRSQQLLDEGKMCNKNPERT